MLIRKHKQLITFFAALMIVLVQFGALVHATEHPFHHEDTLCFALQSAEQEKHFFYAVPFSLYKNAYISDVSDFLIESISPSLDPYYFSRAPPVITI